MPDPRKFDLMYNFPPNHTNKHSRSVNITLCSESYEKKYIRTQYTMWINTLYRVSQEECEILRESVPWVKLYRYNPKHLYPKLNGYGDNGQRSLKLWQLLHTYWLPNSYWNWLEYVVSVMLISVLNIKVTCKWHKAIKLNYKNSRIHVFALLRLRSTVHRPPDRFLSCDVRATVLKTFSQGHCMMNIASRTAYSSWTPQQPTLFDGH